MPELGGEPAGACPTIAAQDLLRGLESAVDDVFAVMLCAPFDLEALRAQAAELARGAGAAAPEPEISVEALVHIRGPLHGGILLKCTARTAESIARGLLLAAPGEAVGAGALEDAIGECANMVAGVLKTRLLDPRGAFALGLPSLSTPQASPAGRPGALAYRLCSGALTAEVWLDSRMPAI